MRYLIQSGDIMRKEGRCITHNAVKFSYSDLYSLPQYIGDYTPVGSVEFTAEFARLNNLYLPANISYPKELLPFLNRKVWQDEFSNVKKEMFVKPVNTKVFTGAIKNVLVEQVNEKELVWVSNPVEFTAEFRFYILDKKILGYSRYDDSEEDEIEPDEKIVESMIESFTSQPNGYAIDVGIMNGETVLIEINDGWSLGYYPWGNCSEKDYVALITARWTQIRYIKKLLIQKFAEAFYKAQEDKIPFIAATSWPIKE